uniref:Uncharacterized protein n=1 Tax=Echeneis naucrates TaxID=173247 RepID=A0A665UW52_ECHNA
MRGTKDRNDHLIRRKLRQELKKRPQNRINDMSGYRGSCFKVCTKHLVDVWSRIVVFRAEGLTLGYHSLFERSEHQLHTSLNRPTIRISPQQSTSVAMVIHFIEHINTFNIR